MGTVRTYAVTFVSPIDGREYPLEEPIRAGPQGACEIPRGPINQDWVLVVRPRGQGAEAREPDLGGSE
jgi:hypothetical protein